MNNLARQAMRAHSKALFHQLDAVQNMDWLERKSDCHAANGTRTNYTFATILCLFVLCFVDCMIGLHYEYTGSLAIGDLATSPYTALHQVPPQIMWFQTDPMIYMCFGISVVVLAILVRHSYLPVRYRLYPLNGGKNLVVDSRGWYTHIPLYQIF